MKSRGVVAADEAGVGQVDGQVAEEEVGILSFIFLLAVRVSRELQVDDIWPWEMEVEHLSEHQPSDTSHRTYTADDHILYQSLNEGQQDGFKTMTWSH